MSVSLHPLFADHAVLPRDLPLPVSGRSIPGQAIKVSIAGQQVTTRADMKGRWSATLEPLPAGGPHTLTVSTSVGQLIRRNLLVGDVWLASGQSNMEWPLRDSSEATKALASARLPRVRMFKVPRRAAMEPCTEPEGRWEECTSKTAADFSAIGFHFARLLNEALDCPIGIIQAAWGGTAGLPWTSAGFIRNTPELAPMAEPLNRVRQLVPETATPGHFEMIEQAFPSGLFNGMIAPLTSYPIHGVIWYQGESDIERAHLYRTIFDRIILSWRAAWDRADLPFLFVQLANHLERRQEPADDAWAELREAQALALRLPATGMVVAADLGDAADIHPRNKRSVAERLLMVALSVAYGRTMPHAGPTYTSHTVEGANVRVRFGNTTGGLRVRGNELLAGFEIAGTDRRFHAASALVDGTSVVLSHPDVPAPIAIRYGWQANPPMQLENGLGLPAAPFRTDDWPGLTAGKV